MAGDGGTSGGGGPGPGPGPRLLPLSGDDPAVLGPYRLLGRLGAGGMGRIYLGRVGPGAPLVAVKTLLAEGEVSDADRRRFTREVTLAQRVDNAYTAKVVHADPAAPSPWMAIEYIPAPSLAELVRYAGRLPASAIRWIAAGTAQALDALHRQGVVHRDVKPQNILLPLDGPRLIDFGISHAQDITRTTITLGTIAFTSPEQARAEPSTAASDVYSLGATLFHLAVGRPPYPEGEDTLRLLVRVSRGDLDLTGLPKALDPLIRPCLDVNPHRRPRPEQVLQRFLAELAGLPNSRSGRRWLPSRWTELIETYERQGDAWNRGAAVTDPDALTVDHRGGGAPPPAPTRVYTQERERAQREEREREEREQTEQEAERQRVLRGQAERERQRAEERRRAEAKRKAEARKRAQPGAGSGSQAGSGSGPDASGGSGGGSAGRSGSGGGTGTAGGSGGSGGAGSGSASRSRDGGGTGTGAGAGAGSGAAGRSGSGSAGRSGDGSASRPGDGGGARSGAGAARDSGAAGRSGSGSTGRSEGGAASRSGGRGGARSGAASRAAGRSGGGAASRSGAGASRSGGGAGANRSDVAGGSRGGAGGPRDPRPSAPPKKSGCGGVFVAVVAVVALILMAQSCENPPWSARKSGAASAGTGDSTPTRTRTPSPYTPRPSYTRRPSYTPRPTYTPRTTPTPRRTTTPRPSYSPRRPVLTAQDRAFRAVRAGDCLDVYSDGYGRWSSDTPRRVRCDSASAYVFVTRVGSSASTSCPSRDGRGRWTHRGSDGVRTTLCLSRQFRVGQCFTAKLDQNYRGSADLTVVWNCASGKVPRGQTHIIQITGYYRKPAGRPVNCGDTSTYYLTWEVNDGKSVLCTRIV